MFNRRAFRDLIFISSVSFDKLLPVPFPTQEFSKYFYILELKLHKTWIFEMFKEFSVSIKEL